MGPLTVDKILKGFNKVVSDLEKLQVSLINKIEIDQSKINDLQDNVRTNNIEFDRAQKVQEKIQDLIS